MSTTEEQLDVGRAGYRLEGTVLQACQCGVLSPSWVGEDPDEGECHGFDAYRIDAGHVCGVDVSGVTVIQVVEIPGNALAAGTWRVVRIFDTSATPEQREALLALFRGELGGPLADLAKLVREEVGVEVAPVAHEVVHGSGTITVPGVLEARIEPYRGPDGSLITLRDGVFSTVPGSPAWVAKASRHEVRLPRYGMCWEYRGRNAIQSEWRLSHRA